MKFFLFCFVVFVFLVGTTHSSAQSLLLTMHSGVTPGRAQKTRCGAGDWTRVCSIQSKSQSLYYHCSPDVLKISQRSLMNVPRETQVPGLANSSGPGRSWWVEERLPYCCVVRSLVTSREGECQKMASNAKTWQWQQCMFIGCCCVRGKQCSQLSTVIIQLDSGKLTE